MLILLTNDDGVYAEGLKALQKELRPFHEVYVVAPEREMSATGHAITLHKPLRVAEVKMRDGTTSWAVNGTPSDCVKLAVKTILPHKPDIVISGINNGSNMGTDVFYSGTVSAAVEGHFMGFPAVAVSLVVDSQEPAYACAALYIKELLDSMGDKILTDKLLLNINIPYQGSEDIKGTKITKLGQRTYINVFDQRVDPRGRKYYWMAGDLAEELADDELDTGATKKGFVSITPLNLDLTNFAQIEELKKLI